MTDEEEGELVPEGAAVFPEIPEDLGVDPLLLAVIHATVFLAGSDDHVVHPDAASEAVEAMAAYLRRLRGPRLRRLREDMDALTAYAREAGWGRPEVEALQSF